MALSPRNVASLFAPLHAELMSLLRGLSADDWQRPTVAPRWRVRDVAAHLLDGQLRKLAAHRDGHLLPADGFESILALINSLNAGGVAYAERLSTRLLVDLLAVVGEWSAAFVESLDPDAAALFSVAWAGEERSANWMDTGREYTEWWHHQMQIGDAVGKGALLLERRWLEPLLDFSLRALPFQYGAVEATDGTSIAFTIGEDVWSLVRRERAWDLLLGPVKDPAAEIDISPDNAWRVLYNALPGEQARTAITARGDERLIAPFLRVRSVMV